ncbi:MAG: 30S ribosomal protein S2 [Elusimicrobiota bacterium]|nr:30S ribosomal protein S2 [Elusimicrobiota bacterium]
MATITIKTLLEAGAHFGHQTKRWNPKMKQYIFGEKNKVHIIDLQKTVNELKRIYKIVREIASTGKPMLFVGTKPQAKEVIEEEAKRCEAFFVSDRWIGGTLTNFETVKKSVARLEELERMKQEGIFKLLSKKECSRREKELLRLQVALRGIRWMSSLPGLVFIVDPKEEEVAVREARKMSIPIVAVCDTDSDPDMVDYCIPGNDDAVRSVKVFASIIADAILEGRELIQKQTETQISPESEVTGLPQEEILKPIDLSEVTRKEAAE